MRSIRELFIIYPSVHFISYIYSICDILSVFFGYITHMPRSIWLFSFYHQCRGTVQCNTSCPPVYVLITPTPDAGRCYTLSLSDKIQIHVHRKQTACNFRVYVYRYEPFATPTKCTKKELSRWSTASTRLSCIFHCFEREF